MVVSFGQVQGQAGGHQDAAAQHPAADIPLTECECDGSADEGRNGKDGCCPSGTEGPLREQIQAQAQAVAGRADQ